MEVSEVDRKIFTFTWKIKNFSFCWHKNREYISSPPFKVHKRDRFSWRLRLYPNNCVKNIELITCMLVKVEEGFPSRFLVSYELAFLTQDESTLNSVEVRDTTFRNLFSVPLNVHRRAVLVEERAAFLPDDKLAIQCRIWDSENFVSETGKCFAETEIEIERHSSVWKIERFRSISEGERLIQRFPLESRVIPCCILSLYQKDRAYIIEIKPLHAKTVKFCKCQLFLLDATGKMIKCGSYGFQSNEKEINVLSVTHENLMENQGLYLPNNVLSLQFFLEFSTGKETGQISENDSSPNLLEFSTGRETGPILEAGSSPNLLEIPDIVTTDNFQHSIINNTKSSLSWKDDLLLMFKNGHICDTVLKTSSETFPVHSLILRIRSPVFSDILSMDDCKSLKDGVYIEKLDTNTVHKMISYLYTDTLDDLDWESAKNLYCASNKYEITSLKQVCATFLKRNLKPTNCCEILGTAARYQDHDLISVVQCFISKHDKEILASDAWINLEKNNPLVACKTLRKLYLKN